MTDRDRYAETVRDAIRFADDMHDTRLFLRGVLVGAAGTAALFLLAMGVL